MILPYITLITLITNPHKAIRGRYLAAMPFPLSILIASTNRPTKHPKVFGIVGGFAGFWDEKQPPMDLTVKNVELIQHEGGSILG